MYDPYAEKSPYEILGVPPTASAVELRDRHNELQRAVQEQGGDVRARATRKQELTTAYDKLRTADQRVRVDFMLLDPQIGLKQCEALAKTFLTPNTKIEGLIQPKSIRVTHAALLAEPRRFEAEPTAPPPGLHPQPLDADEPLALPGPLAIQFDC